MLTLLFALCLYVSYLNGANWIMYTAFSLIYIITKLCNIIKDIAEITVLKEQYKKLGKNFGESTKDVITGEIKGKEIMQEIHDEIS